MLTHFDTLGRAQKKLKTQTDFEERLFRFVSVSVAKAAVL